MCSEWANGVWWQRSNKRMADAKTEMHGGGGGILLFPFDDAIVYCSSIESMLISASNSNNDNGGYESNSPSLI